MQAPRRIFLYKRADVGGLRGHLARYGDSFLSTGRGRVSVNDMWVGFGSEVLSAIERFIPSKVAGTVCGLPWIDGSIGRLVGGGGGGGRGGLCFRARKSGGPGVGNHYKRFRAHVQKSVRDAYWKHITNVFSFENDGPDPDCPRGNEKAEKFWSFVGSLGGDASGIDALGEGGVLGTGTLDGAGVCDGRFRSAFARESDDGVPSGGAGPFAAVGGVAVDPGGVVGLLSGLGVRGAPGPDGLSARVSKECSSEIAPVLTCIFGGSLARGAVPDGWRRAGVAPVFRKGGGCGAANCRRCRLLVSVAGL